MIPVKNIYYMLSYAFSILKEDRYKNIEVEEFDNIYDMFSTIIVKGVSLLIKRGLGREYKSFVEIISSPHGKIEVSSSIKKKLVIQQKLECQYDEYTSDIKLNQIIKTTISLLLKQNIKKSIKKELKIIMIYFKDVSLIDYRNISWDFCFNRNNRHYELLVTMCFLVIKGFIQTNQNGSYELMNFIDEQRMCRLYEKFILEFYKRECSWIKASSSKINWILDDNIADNLPNMQSDIILEANNNVLIIDAKYYQINMQERFDKKSIISNNLY